MTNNWFLADRKKTQANGIICVSVSLRLLITLNANQLKALHIFNPFRQTTSTCFGNVYCPSSGGIHCICTAIYTNLVRYLKL
jgi:hypothetical protein